MSGRSVAVHAHYSETLATMRRSIALIGLFAVAIGSGCSLVANSARNLCNEPALALEECRFSHRARSLAREAWDHYPERASACGDFRDGYIDGYADYLEVGRTTDPPPAPPKRYLKIVYHTPATLRAVEDYYAGFHAGAAAAQSSGQRQRMIVPVIFPVREDNFGSASVPIGPKPETLPAPRELPKRPPGTPEERGPEPTAAARLRAPR